MREMARNWKKAQTRATIPAMTIRPVAESIPFKICAPADSSEICGSVKSSKFKEVKGVGSSISVGSTNGCQIRGKLVSTGW
mmetsp:Transcript_9564/g.14824  ORF Transcript_9564/g.14824 Transcript_9564/m.14824 type:complete len:81 (-) Transcript_9564:170-412(-)